MPRAVRDAKLDSRHSRSKLRLGPKPHWRGLAPGVHVGFRRRNRDKAGIWLVRRYVGLDPNGVGRYREKALGLADDLHPADGKRVLSFEQAVKPRSNRPIKATASKHRAARCVCGMRSSVTLQISNTRADPPPTRRAG
jgi:hypothetical protein